MGRQRWYSNSCDTCHERHVKCDKRKPSCERCMKAGIRCHRRYLNGSVHIPKLGQPVRTVVLSIKPQSSVAPRIDTTYAISWPQTPSQWPLNQQQILSTFMSEIYPSEGTVRGVIVAGHQSFSWFQHLPEEHGKKRLTDTSAVVLSMNFLGTKYEDNDLLHWSEVKYQELCKEIRRLKNPTEDLIPIAANLSIHGLYSTSSKVDPWMVHVRSASKFLQERGPDKSIDRRLYCLLRTSVLYDSCGLRKSTFMSLPEWQRVAPEDEPFERVLEISMFLPSVEELSDDIRLAASYSPKKLAFLRPRFLQLFTNTFTQLRQWYLNLLKCGDTSPFTIRPARPGDLTFLQDHPELQGVFPEVIEFSDQYTFQILLLCWTGFFILYAEAAEVMRELNTNLEDVGLPWGAHCTRVGCTSLEHERDLTLWPCSPAHDTERAIQEVEEMATIFASRICQVVAFCDTYPYGSALKLVVLSPLWIVQQFFMKRLPQRWLWCKEVLSCFPSRNMEFGRFLSKLSFDSYPSTQLTNAMPPRYITPGRSGVYMNDVA